MQLIPDWEIKLLFSWNWMMSLELMLREDKPIWAWKQFFLELVMRYLSGWICRVERTSFHLHHPKCFISSESLPFFFFWLLTCIKIIVLIILLCIIAPRLFGHPYNFFSSILAFLGWGSIVIVDPGWERLHPSIMHFFTFQLVS